MQTKWQRKIYYRCPAKYCYDGDTRIIVAIDVRNHYSRITHCTECGRWFRSRAYNLGTASESEIINLDGSINGHMPLKWVRMYIKRMLNNNDRVLKGGWNVT